MKKWRKIIKLTDSLVNLIIALCLIPILLYGIYAIWDSSRIYKQADVSVYQSYRPGSNTVESFADLQKINPEVFGWITIENTNIDYPLVQSQYNSKYVNTDVKGQFSLSGSIFLDCKNDKSFTDINNVIYGHHMQKDAMFGELEYFEKNDYFNEHKNGKIFYDNKWHDIQFFAFLEADAYDTVLFNTELRGSDESKMFIDYVKENALNFRDLSFNTDEHFVTLSTCNSTSTNSRHILVGKILN